MNTDQLLVAIASFVAAGLIFWVLAMWWFGRKLTVAAARIEKLEKAHQLSTQQTMHARKKVEKLQKELAEQRQSVNRTDAEKEKVKRMEAALRVDDMILNSTVAAPRPNLPKSGFADTLPMED